MDNKVLFRIFISLYEKMDDIHCDDIWDILCTDEFLSIDERIKTIWDNVLCCVFQKKLKP